jgi:hypothetical protein
MPGRAGLKQFASTHRSGWMFRCANGTLLNNSIAAGDRPDFAGQPVGSVAQVRMGYELQCLLCSGPSAQGARTHITKCNDALTR